MARILMTPEGKKVVINKKNDKELYGAPVNPPNTGTRYTSGTDLYAHKSRSGNWYYYTYSWSMWQGEESSYELISEGEAREFILSRTNARGSIDEDLAEELFPGIFEEDA